MEFYKLFKIRKEIELLSYNERQVAESIIRGEYRGSLEVAKDDLEFLNTSIHSSSRIENVVKNNKSVDNSEKPNFVER